ncbi:MAG: hypothetical protein JNK50_03050 [Bacteroidia bacterium]|nr:hypothetical protein [Bacteroidia bacterium]
MKKFIFLFSTLTITVNPQIKVFSGGSVTIGSTASPATYGVSLRLVQLQLGFLAKK